MYCESGSSVPFSEALPGVPPENVIRQLKRLWTSRQSDVSRSGCVGNLPAGAPLPLRLGDSESDRA